LSITNTGSESERFIVDVIGLPREWVRIDRPELEVAPSKTEQVIVSFKPLRHSNSTPGDYPVTVIVRHKHETTTLLKGDLTLHVLPFSGFGMGLESRELTQDSRFRLHLHNQGSAPLPLTISGLDRENLLRVVISPAKLTLAPGQRMVVQGQARLRKSALFGDSARYPFDILVRSGDKSGFLAAARLRDHARCPAPLDSAGGSGRGWGAGAGVDRGRAAVQPRQ
jgi:hypothetical protein